MMGVINLKWREATTTAGQNFTQAERNTGWPETLKHGQLCALQYPCDKGDAAKFRVAQERCLDIGAACKRGDLAHTLAPAMADGLSGLSTYAVTAPAFAGWLAAQGEAPSPYIAAWFEAVGTATPAPVVNSKAKRRTWRDVSSPYIVEVMQAGQYATCKELYRALEAKAGPDSPFDKGIGDNRGSLFVRQIAQSLNLKTVQNEWQTLRKLAQK